MSYIKSKTTAFSGEFVDNYDTTDSFKVEITKGSENLIIDYLTNLYSNPAKAVIRELFSNACDASSNGEKIKIILNSDNSGEFSLIVRDNGCGMSGEELRNNYINYGSSTKVYDMDAVGAFGLGSKSPMAIVPSYEVISSNGEECNRCIVSKTSTGVYGKIETLDTTGESFTSVKLDGIKHRHAVTINNYILDNIIRFSNRDIEYLTTFENGDKLEETIIELPAYNGYSSHFYFGTNNKDKIGKFVKAKILDPFFKNSEFNEESSSIPYNINVRINSVTYPIYKAQNHSNTILVVDVEPGYFQFSPSREEIPAGCAKDKIYTFADVRNIFNKENDDNTINAHDIFKFVIDNELLNKKDLFVYFYNNLIDNYKVVSSICQDDKTLEYINNEETDIKNIKFALALAQSGDILDRLIEFNIVKNATEAEKYNIGSLYTMKAIPRYSSRKRIDAIDSFEDLTGLKNLLHNSINFNNDETSVIDVEVVTNVKKTRKGEFVAPNGYKKTAHDNACHAKHSEMNKLYREFITENLYSSIHNYLNYTIFFENEDIPEEVKYTLTKFCGIKYASRETEDGLKKVVRVFGNKNLFEDCSANYKVAERKKLTNEEKITDIESRQLKNVRYVSYVDNKCDYTFYGHSTVKCVIEKYNKDNDIIVFTDAFSGLWGYSFIFEEAVKGATKKNVVFIEQRVPKKVSEYISSLGFKVSTIYNKKDIYNILSKYENEFSTQVNNNILEGLEFSDAFSKRLIKKICSTKLLHYYPLTKSFKMASNRDCLDYIKKDQELLYAVAYNQVNSINKLYKKPTIEITGLHKFFSESLRFYDILSLDNYTEVYENSVDRDAVADVFVHKFVDVVISSSNNNDGGTAYALTKSIKTFPISLDSTNFSVYVKNINKSCVYDKYGEELSKLSEVVKEFNNDPMAKYFRISHLLSDNEFDNVVKSKLEDLKVKFEGNVNDIVNNIIAKQSFEM